jgi:hypothetical protein
MFLDPCDPLVNRLFREFRANTPSLIPVERIRSTFQFHTPHQEQKHALAGGLSFTVEQMPDEQVYDAFAYYFSLRVLANASAKAGNFMVNSATDVTVKIVYAPLDKNLNYADHAIRCAVKRDGGQRNVVAWLREKDLYTRGMMVNFMRGGLSQGEALDEALSKCEQTWTSGRTESGSKRDRSPVAPMEDRTSSRKGGAPKTTLQRKYASTGRGNKKFCVAWNRGKCTSHENQCAQGHVHACNVIVEGKACSNKSHRAVNHDN